MPSDCSELSLGFLQSILPCHSVVTFCERALEFWQSHVAPEAAAPGSPEASATPLILVRSPTRRAWFSVGLTDGDVRATLLKDRPWDGASSPGRDGLRQWQRCEWLTEVEGNADLIGEIGTAADSSASGPAEQTWSQLVLAVWPQIYSEESTFLKRKLEAMAEFAAGAGHEINNPAATIVGRAGQLLREETDPERRRHLATIGAQAYRIRDMIGDAILFARPPRPSFADVRLSEVVQSAVSLLDDPVQKKSLAVTVETTTDPEWTVPADRTQMEIVFCELLRNAIEASSTGQTIRIAPRQFERSGQRLVEWLVEDFGRGFTETEREHLFDPFFSGRQAGRGLGFGLSKTWRIVDQHRGSLTVEAEPSATRFFLTMPAAS